MSESGRAMEPANSPTPIKRLKTSRLSMANSWGDLALRLVGSSTEKNMMVQ